jgi:cell wall-associated NlpC family hydrolase
MFRLRYRTRRQLKAAAVVAVLFAALAGIGGAHHASAGTARATAAAVQAPPARLADEVISFARDRAGCPYVWGGTGPCGDGYDCSGLVMEAFSQIGVTFGSTRPTADTEWLYGRHVARPARGDLVFFAGGDGTASAPGHVGIVIDPAEHLMIDAYAAGLPVEYDTYNLPGSKDGLSPVVGFTDPYPGASS